MRREVRGEAPEPKILLGRMFQACEELASKRALLQGTRINHEVERKEKEVRDKMKCKHCGKEFDNPFNDRRRKYCSDECFKAEWREYYKNRQRLVYDAYKTLERLENEGIVSPTS